MARFEHVFESSPWFAEQVYEQYGGRFDSADELASQFDAVLINASESRQRDLLKAHPELACAVSEDLTEASRREQAGAGLSHCSQDEFDSFAALNRAYTLKFGFPFIIAVSGLHRSEILAQFRTRIENEADEEFENALLQVSRIARFRIADACPAVT